MEKGKKFIQRIAVRRHSEQANVYGIVFGVVALIAITGVIIWFVAFNSQIRFQKSDNPAVVGYQKKALEMQRAVNQSPTDAGTRLEYARALYGAGEAKLALEQFKRAAELNKNDQSIQRSIGNIYRDMGQFNDAETAYKKAIELAPKDKNAYIDLANLQSYKLKKPLDAVATLSTALQKCGDSSDLRLLQGLAYEQASEYGKARVVYEQLLARDPNYTAAKNNLDRLNLKR